MFYVVKLISNVDLETYCVVPYLLLYNNLFYCQIILSFGNYTICARAGKFPCTFSVNKKNWMWLVDNLVQC